MDAYYAIFNGFDNSFNNTVSTILHGPQEASQTPRNSQGTATTGGGHVLGGAEAAAAYEAAADEAAAYEAAAYEAAVEAAAADKAAEDLA